MMSALDMDLRIALSVWWRNATLYRRTWMMNVLPNFFEPVLYLVGMGIGLGAYLEQGMGGTEYLAFIAPGLMAGAAMNGSTFETTYNMFIKLHFNRLYDAYLGTPATLGDIVLGELLWAVTRATIYGGTFLIVLFALTLAGFPILTDGWSLALLPLIVLIGALFALIGATFTSLVKTIDLYSYFYTLFLTPLFLFSGIFFPTDRFPYGDTIAWFTPLYHGVRASRGFAQGEVTAEVWISIAWMAVVTMVLFVVVPNLMKKKLVT